MKIFEGRTMRGEVIRLDGKHFIDCLLVQCTLEYSGGDVLFERTSIHDCHHLLYGYARQTANYLRTVGLMDETPEKPIELRSKVN